MHYVWQGVIVAILWQIRGIKIVANSHYVCQGTYVEISKPESYLKNNDSMTLYTWKVGQSKGPTPHLSIQGVLL